MRHTIQQPMTADQFLKWAEGQPGKYELVNGEVVTIEAERAPHVALKTEVLFALRTGIRSGDVPCRAWADGMEVRIDKDTVYRPDASVSCSDVIRNETLALTSPEIVVEVMSPSTSAHDMGAKLVDYFRLASLRHYLLFRTEQPSVIYHQRHEDSDLITRLVAGGILRLDPPGIEIDVDAIYRDASIEPIG